jgi:hypothetical protein
VLCRLVGAVLVWAANDRVLHLLVNTRSPVHPAPRPADLYSLQNAGLSTSAAFSLSLGNYSMLIAGTIIVWFCESHARTRTILCSQSPQLWDASDAEPFTSLGRP